MMTIQTASPQQTYELAKRAAQLIKGGVVFCLKGDLGAGKTLFVQGLADGLQAREEVTSPTFSIMNIYQGKFTIVHFDLYRLESAEELEDIGFYEYSQQEDAVVLIEWPDKFWEELPEDYLLFSIERGKSSEERLIGVASRGGKYDDFMEELRGIC